MNPLLEFAAPSQAALGSRPVTVAPKTANVESSPGQSTGGQSTASERRRASIRGLFESRVRATADSRKTGEQLIATWVDIEKRLAALIGQRGVDALFSRSLHVASQANKILAGLDESPAGPATYGDVAARLIAVEPALTRETSLALLLSFTDLLSSLIGDSLTDRLLGPVWKTPEPEPAPTATGQETAHE